jgi:hypothetical protein
MAAVLAEVETDQPVRVPLVEGQSARGLRTAISRAATSRGLTVETVEGGASSRRARSMSRRLERRSRQHVEKGSEGAADYRSARSRMRPRSSHCRTWQRGKARGLGRLLT